MPSSEQGELTIMNIGQFSNDLAMPEVGGRQDYYGDSRGSNVLVLVQRLERDPERPDTVLPSRPISTLAMDVVFDNAAPMELGCQYGSRYWQSAASRAQ